MTDYDRDTERHIKEAIAVANSHSDEMPPDDLCSQCGVRRAKPGHTACSVCAG